MFIDDSTYASKGKTYRRVLLRNSYRVNGVVKHDTIANLSKCSVDDLSHLKKALKLAKKDPFDQEDSSFKLKQGLSVGAIWTLHQIAKDIGISEALGNSREAKLVLWMIYARLLGKGSRLSATRLMSQHVGCDVLNLDSFTEDDLYDAMDWVEKNQGEIEKDLFQRKYKEKLPVFYLYDVTSSYLEGTQNELGEFGYNRDGKKSKQQIVIGLMTDAEGWPIAIEVFEGNTNDTKTVKSQIRKLANRFGVEEVTFVGDRGMIKRTQIEDLKDEEFHYITAITKPEIETLVKKEIIPLSLFDIKVAEIDLEGIRYIFRRNPQRAKEIEDSRQSKFNRLIELCDEKNEYLKTHKKAKESSAKKAIENKAKDLKIFEWIDIKEHGRNITISINQQKKKEKMILDGCYVLKTDRKKEDISTQEIHDRYKSLADVEWAFRTMKTTLLEMRGIFVRKATRTKAHVFVVMLSYMIAYKLRRHWHDLEVTVEEGISELSSIYAMEVHFPQISYQQIPQPRSSTLLLLEKAGITLPDAIPFKGTVVLTRKKLVSERKKLRPKCL
jgi:transposase